MDGLSVMVVAASAGAGHLRAAQALVRAAEEAPAVASVSAVDFLAFSPGLYGRAYGSVCLQCMRYVPEMWGALYEHTRDRKASAFGAFWLSRFQWLVYREFRDHIRAVKPDLILATHFAVPGIVGHLFPGPTAPMIGTVVTDYDVHGFWISEHTDCYYVGSAFCRERLLQRGVPSSRILVTGIPVDAHFRGLPAREPARDGLGWPRRSPTVLLVFGGDGVGPVERIVQAVLDRWTGRACAEGLHLVAVAGHNAHLKARLQRISVPAGIRFSVYGYVENLHLMMAASDLAVGKAGGLFCTECLAARLPLFIPLCFPGQESRNADFLVSSGAGLCETNPDRWGDGILRLLGDARRLTAMSDAAGRTVRPDAARAVVEDCCTRYRMRQTEGRERKAFEDSEAKGSTLSGRGMSHP